MVKPPRRHHYLPQFYLRYFTDDNNQLWEFDRVEKKYTQKTPKGTAWAPHYYRYKGKDGNLHTDIEDEFFQTIEDKSKPIIDKIIRKEDISLEEKAVLASFVAFQHTRVPDFEKKMNELSEKMVKEINKRMYSSVEDTKERIMNMDNTIDEAIAEKEAKNILELIKNDSLKVVIPKERSIKSMMLAGSKMSEYLFSMDWLFLYAPNKSSFITSDNPFFILPPVNRDPDNFWERGVGIATPGARKLCVLSNKVCLAILEPGEVIARRQIEPKAVREINCFIAVHSDQYLVSRDKELLERVIKITKVDTWLKENRIEMG